MGKEVGNFKKGIYAPSTIAIGGDLATTIKGLLLASECLPLPPQTRFTSLNHDATLINHDGSGWRDETILALF